MQKCLFSTTTAQIVLVLVAIMSVLVPMAMMFVLVPAVMIFVLVPAAMMLMLVSTAMMLMLVPAAMMLMLVPVAMTVLEADSNLALLSIVRVAVVLQDDASKKINIENTSTYLHVVLLS